MNRLMQLCCGKLPVSPQLGLLETILVRRRLSHSYHYRNAEDTICLAGTAWQSSVILWVSFLSWVLGNIEAEVLIGICLVAYTVFDEASTRFKVDSGDSSTNTNAKKKDDNLAKMLHGRLWIGMAVQGSLTNGKIVLLSGEMALPLMSMPSTSAETMYKALQQSGALPALSLLSGKFKMAVNAATADKAASNLRLLLARRFLNPHAASFITFCRIFCLATVVGRSTKLTQMELDVSGIVRFALSLGGAGSARDLREHMARTLMVRLGDQIRCFETSCCRCCCPDLHQQSSSAGKFLRSTHQQSQLHLLPTMVDCRIKMRSCASWPMPYYRRLYRFFREGGG